MIYPELAKSLHFRLIKTYVVLQIHTAIASEWHSGQGFVLGDKGVGGSKAAVSTIGLRDSY